MKPTTSPDTIPFGRQIRGNSAVKYRDTYKTLRAQTREWYTWNPVVGAIYVNDGSPESIEGARLLIFPAFCEHYGGIQVTYSQLFLSVPSSSFLVHQPGAHRPVSAGVSRSCRFTLFPCFRPFFFRPPRVSVSFTEPLLMRGGDSLPRHASSSTVVIIYRSPFSAQVIPAKIVASVNYYYATSLHLWISIVPRSGDLLLLRIIPVKRGEISKSDGDGSIFSVEELIIALFKNCFSFVLIFELYVFLFFFFCFVIRIVLNDRDSWGYVCVTDRFIDEVLINIGNF